MNFRFKSLTRGDKVGYIYNGSLSNTPSSFYHNPMNCVSSHLHEYLTYGDGAVQHSPAYPVAAENYMDVMSSLASHLLNDLVCAKEFSNDLFVHQKANGDEIKFLASLQYREDKTVYFCLSDLKKTTSASKEHDKRYERVPKNADGSAEFVFYALRQSFYGFLDCVMLIDEIRDHMNYAWIDFEKVLRTKQDWMNLINPVHVIQAIIDSFKKMDYARFCLENNWISRQRKEEVPE